MGERAAMIEKDIELGLAQGPQYFQEVCEFGVLLNNTAKMVQKLKVKLIPTGQVCFPVCSFPSSLSKKSPFPSIVAPNSIAFLLVPLKIHFFSAPYPCRKPIRSSIQSPNWLQ
jgi:hypothetical protein